MSSLKVDISLFSYTDILSHSFYKTSKSIHPDYTPYIRRKEMLYKSTSTLTHNHDKAISESN